MKKILSVLLAAAAAITMSLPVFAADDPTVSFDTDSCLSYIHTFGNASETNLTYEATSEDAYSGKSLLLNESFTDAITNKYGGIYFSASDFGLENFSGYTFTVRLKAESKLSKSTPRLEVFSDGSQWIFTAADSSQLNWTEYSVSVPANVANDKFGISIPVTDGYDGTVAYVDSVVISDNYGKAIANIGDLEVHTAAQAPDKAMSVLTTILFVLLIIAAVVGVAFFVMKVLFSYR